METIDIEQVCATAPDFYHNYIRKAGAGDLLQNMKYQIHEAYLVFGKEYRDKALHRYAEGKWTPTELIGHLTDSERVFQYRAMRFARNDKTELPGFDENIYIANADFNARGVESILEEFVHLRLSGMALYASLSSEEKWRSGVANGKSMSAIALFYANVGHFNHHVGVLRERY